MKGEVVVGFAVGAYLAAAWSLWLVDRTYFFRPLDEELATSAASGGGEESPEVAATVIRIRQKLAAMTPRSIHVVVDTAANRLQVRKGTEVLLDTVCSTGSGGVLEDPATGRKWLFRTPQGVFTVARKAVDPVWTKPDWAFVEEGKPLPERWSERRDYDTLGDYALYFGDGYMIHGTLYQRYLGRSITHGCVRLGDADLEKVYELTPVGARIYIF